MERPWQAEVELDERRVRALLGSQFPDLAGETIRHLASGWDNDCFAVGAEWIFRFPRRELGASLIETEDALLPALAPRLPLPIPVPVHFGLPEGDYPWRFHGYRRLPGETLDRAAPDDASRSRLAVLLARFLRALHDTPPELRAAAPPDRMQRLDLGRRAAQADERLAGLAAAGIVRDPRRWRPLLHELPSEREAGDGALVHGDLYARHLLVDAAGSAAGVIDWGDAHRGDPAIDFGVVHAALPASAHAEFRDAYGTIDDEGWIVGRFKGLHSALMVLAYGSDVGDAALVREGRAALERLAP